jgi:RNA polymerase II subunit A small phosphatase-like protein
MTVVFDLDETLVYAREGSIYIRPGLNELFSMLKKIRKLK